MTTKPALDPFWHSVVTFCNVSTISLCMICKLPQIRAIVSSRSAKGLSLQSVMVELLGYTIVLGYNVVQGYPLASFMEYVFLVVQDIFLLITILHFVGVLDTLKLGLIGLYVAMFYGFTQGIPHAHVLPFLMKFATPCSASSKILQLRAIWESRSSQTVSIATWSIAAYTCVSRITTNLLLTGDVPLLINYGLGLILNTLVIGSALYFRMPMPKSRSGKTTNKSSSPPKKTATDENVKTNKKGDKKDK